MLTFLFHISTNPNGSEYNNNDFVKVLATVAKCTYEFIDYFPGAIIEITPVDKRRRNLYNAVFKRNYLSIQEKFEIFGLFDDEVQPYDPVKDYDRFELIHKV